MINIMNINDKIEFQLYDWVEKLDKYNCNSDDKYIIHSFGRCLDGKSVYAKILGFTPYFYILIPDKLQNKSKEYLDNFKKYLNDAFKNKNNKRLYYKYKNSLIEIQILKFKKAEGFTNNKEFYFARLVFDSIEGMRQYKYYLENNNVIINGLTENINPVKFKLYEANLPPMLRCFHIKEISGCSWIETSYYKLINEDKESLCDIEIEVDWRNLIPINKDINAPLKICSFDIECNSIDGEFPQAKRKGDSIIQIGFTYTLLGESIPYKQTVLCLKETNNLSNINVVCYNSETELLYGFLKEITDNDCDIITGYNIFFFDEKYIYDRCKEVLNIDISFLSKLKDYKCPFIEFKLASSALGVNILKYWNTPGRIHIDLMKDIQKTFPLQSYKLDYVSSKFIRGSIKSFNIINNEIELLCDIIDDIDINDYIHIEISKGFISDDIGDKYLVINKNNKLKTIYINNDNNLIVELSQALKENNIIAWSQAKDDINPKDIFKLYKGTSNDRSIIAKYCVKDCRLVSLLINKLETITKNIEMANVCFVPLSYLFTRGQGIKLFSLCLKEYRKQKYIFPVLKPDKLYKCLKCFNEYYNIFECPKCKSNKREELEFENTTFEGAIVFEPVPSVEYEAIATKDYMSLYPSSIIHKNMSHETIVDDIQYDNLENIKYYNANFKDSDGIIQYRRFAQINNELGVIPTILDTLLKERKNIKKKMKDETESFKYKILDAKQYALKITANSLYGQLGALTSQICKRDIAACTTSTGREMLLLAKKYDEEKLPLIINSLKYYYSINDINTINKIYNEQLITDINIKKNIDEFINEIQDKTFQPVVRYGDSIIGKTPLLLRNSITKKIIITSIDKIINIKDVIITNEYCPYN